MLEEYSDIFSSKLRLGVITALFSGEKDFTSLKKLLDATDGNLGRQLAILEQAGFITARKMQVGKRPRTIYDITQNGKAAFEAYVKALERVLRGVD